MIVKLGMSTIEFNAAGLLTAIQLKDGYRLTPVEASDVRDTYEIAATMEFIMENTKCSEGDVCELVRIASYVRAKMADCQVSETEALADYRENHPDSILSTWEGEIR